jgi:hypothetical protein
MKQTRPTTDPRRTATSLLVTPEAFASHHVGACRFSLTAVWVGLSPRQHFRLETRAATFLSIHALPTHAGESANNDLNTSLTARRIMTLRGTSGARIQKRSSFISPTGKPWVMNAGTPTFSSQLLPRYACVIFGSSLRHLRYLYTRTVHH